MSYVGSAPSPSQVQFSTLDSQAFNGDGSTTAFTLNRAVSIAAAIEVTVNNVQQSPYDGSYSVNGTTTLTFSEAPSSGTDNVYVRFLDYPLISIDANPNTTTLKTSLTGSSILASGTTAQRDVSPSAGYIRFNSDESSFEGYDGSAWGSIGGGSNLTALGLWENAATITANYTITAGNNAMSAGPITVDSGVTVTVPSGSTWTVV